MVQTRSGQASTASESKPKPTVSKSAKAKKPTATENNKTKSEVNKPTAQDDPKPDTTVPEKRKRDDNDTEVKNDADETQETASKEEQPPPSKTAKEDNGEENGEVEPTVAHKIRKTIEEYGTLPLEGLGVDQPLKPTPEILLAIVIDSMLKSTRISHQLAQKASKKVFEAGYHDIKILSKTSWDERVQVLSEGGYNRYRETTATKLEDLANLIDEKYDGDLNNLLEKADNNPSQIRHLVREIKGFGDVATDLFCDDAQAVWPVLAPTIDHRSLDTAEEVGIGRDIDAIYAELGHDPVQMSKLARGLSAVRLSKNQDDIEQED